MTSQDFSSLHDAVLIGIDYDWERSEAQILVRAGGPGSRDARISLTGVRSIAIPRENPWGASSSINEATLEEGVLTLEMQSGDVIVVKAGEVSCDAI